MSRLHRAIPAACEPGATRMPTPTKPAPTPMSVTRGMRSRAMSLKTMTQSGIAAMMRAERPEGASFSASVTSPLPPGKNRTPSTKQASSSRRPMRSLGLPPWNQSQP